MRVVEGLILKKIIYFKFVGLFRIDPIPIGMWGLAVILYTNFLILIHHRRHSRMYINVFAYMDGVTYTKYGRSKVIQFTPY
jgi:hypothetical protein